MWLTHLFTSETAHPCCTTFSCTRNHQIQKYLPWMDQTAVEKQHSPAPRYNRISAHILCFSTYTALLRQTGPLDGFGKAWIHPVTLSWKETTEHVFQGSSSLKFILKSVFWVSHWSFIDHNDTTAVLLGAVVDDEWFYSETSTLSLQQLIS